MNTKILFLTFFCSTALIASEESYQVKKKDDEKKHFESLPNKREGFSVIAALKRELFSSPPSREEVAWRVENLPQLLKSAQKTKPNIQSKL